MQFRRSQKILLASLGLLVLGACGFTVWTLTRPPDTSIPKARSARLGPFEIRALYGDKKLRIGQALSCVVPGEILVAAGIDSGGTLKTDPCTLTIGTDSYALAIASNDQHFIFQRDQSQLGMATWLFPDGAEWQSFQYLKASDARPARFNIFPLGHYCRLGKNGRIDFSSNDEKNTSPDWRLYWPIFGRNGQLALLAYPGASYQPGPRDLQAAVIHDDLRLQAQTIKDVIDVGDVYYKQRLSAAIVFSSGRVSVFDCDTNAFVDAPALNGVGRTLASTKEVVLGSPPIVFGQDFAVTVREVNSLDHRVELLDSNGLGYEIKTYNSYDRNVLLFRLGLMDAASVRLKGTRVGRHAPANMVGDAGVRSGLTLFPIDSQRVGVADYLFNRILVIQLKETSVSNSSQ